MSNITKVVFDCVGCQAYEEYDQRSHYDEACEPDHEGRVGTQFSHGRKSMDDDWKDLCDSCWEKRHAVWYVNLYRISRHFGGREEGGWWYDAGKPAGSMPIGKWPEDEDTRPEEISEQMAAALGITLDTGYRFNVVPQDDDYGWRVEPHMAKAWPESKPFYC